MPTSNNGSVFTVKDLEIIQGMVFDPQASPGYCWIKSCLIWEDERALGLTPQAYERVAYLWIARGFIHRDSFCDCPEYCCEAWESELSAGLPWPGFKRIRISVADLEYMRLAEKALQEEAY